MIHVSIVDDDPHALHSQQHLLSPMQDLQLVHAGADVAAYLAAGAKTDVVVLDLILRDGRPAAENVRRLLATGARVLVTSTRDDHPQIRSAVRAGAGGFLTKKTDGPRLADAIRDIHTNKRVLTPELAHYVTLEPPDLTDRQFNIARDWARGMSYRMIANKYGITVGGVRSHLNKVFDKFAKAGDPIVVRPGDTTRNRIRLRERLPDAPAARDTP